MRWLLALAEAFSTWRARRHRDRFLVWVDRAAALRAKQDRRQGDLFEGRDA